MNYNLIRSLLFLLNPELSHNFSLKAMKSLEQIGLLNHFITKAASTPRKLLGLTFENPVGLAAGLDKNGDYIDVLGSLGFGFIEIGTVTPKPQSGNPKPRMFRLEKDQAIINRMGFNNKGVDHLVGQVKKKKYQGVLGINIGKNATTAIENAIQDYLYCLDKVYAHASYITINISSPNTPGLRSLQGTEHLTSMLGELKKRQDQLANQHNKYVPLIIKISPDLNSQEIIDMAGAFLENKIDGIIATNTTLDRINLNSIYANESGGLSGQPLFDKSTQVLSQLKKLVNGQIPIIASGGIMSADQAKTKIEAGADLVQLYTGFIYQGPSLIAECCKVM
ncbi:MAG: quinone-dependent dihydroorotate dehydrogenase [Gammaproteobacteria bacterium]|nr:quinone-dependent dihydroorotate dehydrogenase [Gammaproteobacteria bacterium]